MEALLDPAPHVRLDPLRASGPESGKLMPEAVFSLVSSIQQHLNLSVDLAPRDNWHTGDMGPGMDRHELRALFEDINLIRQALAASGYAAWRCGETRRAAPQIDR